MELILLIVCLIALVVGVAFYFGLFSKEDKDSTVRNMVESQRTAYDRKKELSGRNQKTLLDAISEEEKVKKISASSLSLEKQLRYAQWTLQPSVFYILMALISLMSLLVVSFKFNIIIKILALSVGPLVMYSLLNGAMMARFRKFDADYPSFLLSFVGLLKTGMNPIQALKAASEGLEPGSLVKYEIDLMLERLRIGIPEDQSIGAFAEDIYHEEIELFVQALLLSRKVGGNLSETIDRLAKQVRKRQYFRSSAHHAVGMQRGSIWLILAVLGVILIFIYLKAPDLITDSLNHELGWQVWQAGLLAIIIGVIWIRVVTKIRA
jgi:tight adherence protein B